MSTGKGDEGLPDTSIVSSHDGPSTHKELKDDHSILCPCLSNPLNEFQCVDPSPFDRSMGPSKISKTFHIHVIGFFEILS